MVFSANRYEETTTTSAADGAARSANRLTFFAFESVLRRFMHAPICSSAEFQTSLEDLECASSRLSANSVCKFKSCFVTTDFLPSLSEAFLDIQLHQ